MEEKGITPQFLSDLRRGILDSFSLNEIQSLCFDLGVDYESLGGEGREAKARELIAYLHRRGRLLELIRYCVEARPNYPWPQMNRYASSVAQPPPVQVEVKITILFLSADPTDASRLRLGEEFREINEQLRLARYREKFNLSLPYLSLRPRDISRALLEAQPQIVHFSGHGTSEGALCFEDESGKAHFVQPEALAGLFKQFAEQVKCVVLNACYAEHQATAIAEHIDYVVGMKREISDKAAIAFSVGFYQALGAGKTVEEAFELGRIQIMLQGVPEHLVPVLIKKG